MGARKPGFLLVECTCGNAQRIYKCASSIVRCGACGSVLARPTGGKARVLARVVQTLQ